MHSIWNLEAGLPLKFSEAEARLLPLINLLGFAGRKLAVGVGRWPVAGRDKINWIMSIITEANLTL